MSLVKFLPVWKEEYFIVFVMLGMGICSLAPVQTANKPLDAIERLIYGTRARIVYAIEAVTVVVFVLVGWYTCALAILAAQIILMVSLVAGTVQDVQTK